jgi:hypothetical protein
MQPLPPALEKVFVGCSTWAISCHWQSPAAAARKIKMHRRLASDEETSLHLALAHDADDAANFQEELAVETLIS